MALTALQALDRLHSSDLLGIGMEADAVRRTLHPEGVVSYLIDRRLTLPDTQSSESIEAFYAQAREALELGATGLDLDLPTPLPGLAQVEAVLATLRERFPALRLHGLSATSTAALAASAGLSLADTLSLLRDAGLDSLGGEDAILTPEVEDPTASWLEAHRTAHRLGLQSTAVMVFGLGEPLTHRLHHLEAIRALQQETAGFTSFTPLAFRPSTRAAAPPNWEPPTAVEYLKTLALSRIVLDNIPHIQASNAAQGLKVVQMALRFGSNDVGSVAFEPSAARSSEEDLRRVIRDAGFRPAQRDTLFRTLFLNN